ncbi:MAG: N-acetyl sugar amidotransferase [Alphaproteobacteria bacterium]|nr:N-acetyl sugar amidotransferase [Alphaproteobacteria bacterium]
MSVKICNFCVMDNTDPDILFDEKGQCSHCKSYLQNLPKLPAQQINADQLLQDLVSDIKRRGRGKKYDCVIGLSGGVDSTYVAYVVTKILGLRPIAVHMDNGWNSELSVMNVENIVKKLGIDLYTKVLDWDEFRDLQLAFLKASTPDSEIPTDHAICGTLYEVASKYNIKHLISGANFVTERIMPAAWSQGHSDYRYIKNVSQKFGTLKLSTFPYLNSIKRFYYEKVRGISFVPIFNYFKFDLNEARNIIEQELDWQDYGGKHYESIYTKFFQGYILPQKFGFDKRKGHFSNLICAGIMSRDEALAKLKNPPIEEKEIPYLKQYVAKKFALSEGELESLLNLPVKSYKNYPNAYNSVWYIYSRKYIKPIYRFLIPVGDENV